MGKVIEMRPTFKVGDRVQSRVQFLGGLTREQAIESGIWNAMPGTVWGVAPNGFVLWENSAGAYATNPVALELVEGESDND